MSGLRRHLPEGRVVEVALLDEDLIVVSLTGGQTEVHTIISQEQLVAINQLVVQLLDEKAEA